MTEPITETDRDDVLCAIRHIFTDGQLRDRDTALRDLADALGYKRLGPRIREVLQSDFLTAVRRGVLKNEQGYLSILSRSVEGYDRDFLKDQLLGCIGRTWTDRTDAGRAFARWLGFARTGSSIEDKARSLINGLLREGRIESDGGRCIRRVTR